MKLELFPPLEPYRHGMLPVDDLHTLYWEESGNPDGIPVLFLHGGPGGGTSPLHRRFFDPKAYRIILFDQRGAGKSTPLGEYRQNTTQLLIDDIDALRRLLGVQQWLVFGGSWGSTLALAYAQAQPGDCLGLILRGIFLCSQTEVDWFVHGGNWFHPEAHGKFVDLIPLDERQDLVEAYWRRISSDDPAVYLPAARGWSHYEGCRVSLVPSTAPISQSQAETDAFDVGIGRMEVHYMRNLGFFSEDQLLKGVEKIRHLPAVIVHGRYDVICPPAIAHQLHQAWPEAQLHMIPDAGHSAFEPGILDALVRATEQFKLQRDFAVEAKQGGQA